MTAILGAERGTRLDIRELVSELKRQRRLLDQAIAALETLDKRKRSSRKAAVSGKPSPAPVAYKSTGTGGEIIPFSSAMH
jgi:hypothetical protein